MDFQISNGHNLAKKCSPPKNFFYIRAQRTEICRMSYRMIGFGSEP
jgi:hypothetical protein